MLNRNAGEKNDLEKSFGRVREYRKKIYAMPSKRHAGKREGRGVKERAQDLIEIQ